MSRVLALRFTALELAQLTSRAWEQAVADGDAVRVLGLAIQEACWAFALGGKPKEERCDD